jgi:dihydroorotate dehydrogenase
MVLTNNTRVIDKYGWMWYFALGLLWLIVGLSQLFTPEVLLEDDAQYITDMALQELEASSPEAYKLILWLYMGLGNLKISWSLFVITITLTGYRKGEKWAWYTLWLLPLILASSAVYNIYFFGDISEVVQWIPITFLSIVGLFIPYRKFFPNR